MSRCEELHHTRTKNTEILIGKKTQTSTGRFQRRIERCLLTEDSNIIGRTEYSINSRDDVLTILGIDEYFLIKMVRCPIMRFSIGRSCLHAGIRGCGPCVINNKNQNKKKKKT